MTAAPPDQPDEAAGRPARATGPRGTPGPDYPPAAEDTDAGWGERPEPDDDERLSRERPPHWE
jgi:hypothetical protein